MCKEQCQNRKFLSPAPSRTSEISGDVYTDSVVKHSVYTRVWSRNGLPWWLSGNEPACQWSRCRSDPWVGKIPWRRKWLPTPVLLPGELHGQRSLAGYRSCSCKRVRHTLVTTATTMEQVTLIHISIPNCSIEIPTDQEVTCYKSEGQTVRGEQWCPCVSLWGYGGDTWLTPRKGADSQTSAKWALSGLACMWMLAID